MSRLNTNEIRHSDGTTTTEVSIPSLESKMFDAWVTYNGETNTITGSRGVTSISDIGTGSHDVNLTTAMPDLTYPVILTAGDDTTNAITIYERTNQKAVGRFRVTTAEADGTSSTRDMNYVFAGVIRG